LKLLLSYFFTTSFTYVSFIHKVQTIISTIVINMKYMFNFVALKEGFNYLTDDL